MSDEPTAHVTVSECTSFYFVNVIFQVEDTLFRVPRRYFEQESEVFRAMFQLPVAKGTVPDGSTNEQPLRLEGVIKDDFRQLLRVMFPDHPLKFGLSVAQWSSALKLTALWQMNGLTQTILELLANSNLSREDWLVLLDLSEQYQLPETRSTTIQQLSSMFSGRTSEQIVLGQKYKVVKWVRDGLSELVLRKSPLSDDEGEALGLKTTLKLCRAREMYLRNSGSRLLEMMKKRAVAMAEVKAEFNELREMNSELDHEQT